MNTGQALLCTLPAEYRAASPFLGWLHTAESRNKTWICFQQIPLGTALSKGWCLIFQWESQEVMCPRTTPQGSNLNTLFPHCWRGVIIYSISSIAHHLAACAMWGLEHASLPCFLSVPMLWEGCECCHGRLPVHRKECKCGRDSLSSTITFASAQSR